MAHYDVIVLGTGGVGSATLYELAHRGCRALGIDRFQPGHDRGSSHGATRMIRQAYYEHPDYVPLVRRAWQRWEEFQTDQGRQLLHPTGLLQIGPAGGALLEGVRESARRHALPLEELTPAETMRRYPGIRVPEDFDALFESQAGYLDVEACVVALMEESQRSGAQLALGHSVRRWSAQEGQGVSVETDQATFQADALVITPGAWAPQLLADLAIPWQVLRKPLYWYAAKDNAYDAQRGCPAFLFETLEGFFYGFPQIAPGTSDAGGTSVAGGGAKAGEANHAAGVPHAAAGHPPGVKVAQHDGGRTCDDPLQLDREIDPRDRARVEAFTATYLPSLSSRLLHHTVCMYTMTPDGHFVVDRHPRHQQVVLAAGLSGHGFKFAPALGEALADLVLSGKTSLPIEFLRCDRPGLS